MICLVPIATMKGSMEWLVIHCRQNTSSLVLLLFFQEEGEEVYNSRQWPLVVFTGTEQGWYGIDNRHDEEDNRQGSIAMNMKWKGVHFVARSSRNQSPSKGRKDTSVFVGISICVIAATLISSFLARWLWTCACTQVSQHVRWWLSGVLRAAGKQGEKKAIQCGSPSPSCTRQTFAKNCKMWSLCYLAVEMCHTECRNSSRVGRSIRPKGILESWSRSCRLGVRHLATPVVGECANFFYQWECLVTAACQLAASSVRRQRWRTHLVAELRFGVLAAVGSFLLLLLLLWLWW